MELLEFKHKMFQLCRVNEISQIRDVLYNVALSQDVAFFDGESNIGISNDGSYGNRNAESDRL